MFKNKIEDLIRGAFAARSRAYAPYSRYLVGAALEAEDGTVFHGCNIENASYGATNCAERTALFTGVAAGYRKYNGIVITAGPEEITYEKIKNMTQAELDAMPFPSPCGICRQALREFSNPETFQVIVAKSERVYKEYTLEELLPESFGPEYL